MIGVVNNKNYGYKIYSIELKRQYHYRPQTKFAKVMFLHLSVSHFVHRGVSTPTPWGEVEGSGQGGSPHPHPRGEIEGSGHGGSPGPHPGGRLTGLARGSPGPHPKGGGWEVLLGGGLQSHTWGGPGPDPGGVSQHALRQTPSAADCYCCGQYASYWNAFLFSCFNMVSTSE